MMRRRLTRLLSTKWGRLCTACMVVAVLLWGWSAVLTLGSLGRDHDTADRLASAALVLTVLELLLLGLHEAHLRHLRGEADALDVRQVLDHIRSLRTSANGWITMVLVALGVAAWAYVWVAVRWLGLDVPGVPDADDGGLVMAAGTLSCAAAGIFAVTHFKERR
ncbi:hypothetical protein [Streptomyces griseiscabiei]|uniref:Integral membrane protein n=1 Tax=Streptomyces griseiscabiei TaxID=2993540 RepID=A0ABU4LG42_9ACTN|nr:hypothetical protein [Streptomyces griseiscabiei]MBZ3907233.1 hypothetical protein [Streptomyces griseiscabiei]MDX2914265.1 hypothetical protein [Streptomyces griseiscabiei]